MGEPMTAQELAAIGARLAKATPGPWLYDAERGVVESDITGRIVAEVDDVRCPDGDLIAHAPEDLRRLRAEVERLTRLVTTATVEAANAKKERDQARKLLGHAVTWATLPPSLHEAVVELLGSKEAPRG